MLHSVFQYLTGILQDLTPDDVRHLIQYEDELTQLGSYVFILNKSFSYLKNKHSIKYAY